MHKLILIIIIIIIFIRIKNNEGYTNIVYDNNYSESLKTTVSKIIQNENPNNYITLSNMESDKIETSGGSINTVIASDIINSKNEVSGNTNVDTLCFINDTERYCIKSGSYEKLSKKDNEYMEGVYHMIRPTEHKIRDGEVDINIISSNIQNLVRNSSQNKYTINGTGEIEFENAGTMEYVGAYDGWDNEAWNETHKVIKLNIGSYTLTGGHNKQRKFIESIKLNPGYEITAYWFILNDIRPIWVFRNNTNEIQELTRKILSSQDEYESFPYLTYKIEFNDTTIYKTTNSTYKYGSAVSFITVKKTAIVKTD